MATSTNSAQPETLQVKTCTACGEAKPLTEFDKQAKGKYGVTSQCKPCRRLRISELGKRKRVQIVERKRARRLENPEVSKAYALKYRTENKEKIRLDSLRYRAENADAIRGRHAAYVEQNADLVRDSARRRARLRRSTPQGKIHSSISRNMHHSLVLGTKRGRKAFDLLDYTVEDLRVHLERQFLPGMSWDNYGKRGWHIDHRVPHSSFQYNTPECSGFKAAWALTNLQPLWWDENISKGDKVLYLV